MKHLFIVNPVAGKGHTQKIVPHIEKYMGTHSLPYRVELTKAPGHASKIAEAYIQKHRGLRIYAIGGDGTMNEVLQGVAGSDACLGVVPAGTGNDFLKSFCTVMDPIALLPSLICADPEPVDVCRLNERFFLNIASVGFDADVVANTQHLKRLPLMKGKIAYIGGILMSLIRLKKIEANFQIDDENIHIQSMLLSAFANGRYYGGGMMPVPNAVPNDGMLDFCMIQSMSRLKILRFFPRLIKGTHTEMKEVTVKRFRSLKMESPEPVHVNADGELFQLKRIHIEVIKKGLRFIVPI